MKILFGFAAFSVLLIFQGTSSAQTGENSTSKNSAQALARIESKPDPKWPKLETEVGVTIVLRAVFRSTGQVTDITFIETAPKKPKGYSSEDIKELTKRSIEACRKIRFVPAEKDGHPVSMWMQLEYNFSPVALKEKEKPN